MTLPPPVRKPPLTGGGIACILLGIVLALPSGGCTGLALVMLVVDGSSPGEALSIMLMVLLFAALPLVGGIALIWAGLRMRRALA